MAPTRALSCATAPAEHHRPAAASCLGLIATPAVPECVARFPEAPTRWFAVTDGDHGVRGAYHLAGSTMAACRLVSPPAAP